MLDCLNQMPPHNIELEMSLLSTAIQYPDDDIFDLTPSDFYRTSHQTIFKTISELRKSNTEINITVLANELIKQGRLDEVGGASYLSNLMDEPTVVNDKYSVGQVKGYADLRRMIDLCHATSKKCFSGNPDEISGIVDRFQRESLKIGRVKTDNICSLSDLSYELIDHCEELAKSKGLTGVPSGYKRLDLMTCGFQPTDLIILAGRPSMGKTALAVNCMRNAAKKGYVSDFYSLEMGKLQVAKRFLATETGLNGQKLRNGSFSRDDWTVIHDAAERMHGYPIHIDDTASSNYTEIQKKARKNKKDHNTDIIWIDYLSFLDGDKGLSVVKEIETITRGLKGLAKELEIPIVLLCQLNRLCEQRPDKRPILSDLRDSGAIEQDADLVLFLYRDEVYHNNEDSIGKAEVKIAKQRSGPQGTIELAWLSKSTRFENLENQ